MMNVMSECMYDLCLSVILMSSSIKMFPTSRSLSNTID